MILLGRTTDFKLYIEKEQIVMQIRDGDYGPYMLIEDTINVYVFTISEV